MLCWTCEPFKRMLADALSFVGWTIELRGRARDGNGNHCLDFTARVSFRCARAPPATGLERKGTLGTCEAIHDYGPSLETFRFLSLILTDGASAGVISAQLLRNRWCR